MTPDQYCREIEAYLCRKNDGHLIRVVGPSFDLVAGWAVLGVPIKVAFRGIDRCVERYYARGPRRRPVRIDFCEADVLEAFDEWRRAVGVLSDVPASSDSWATESGATRPPFRDRARPRMSLQAHLDRIILRLTTLRGGGGVTPALDAALERTVRELDVARAGARGLRGQARAQFVQRLEQLDDSLIAAAREACGARRLAELQIDAERDLGAFQPRMPEAAYRAAVRAAVNRLVREAVGLPTLTFD